MHAHSLTLYEPADLRAEILSSDATEMRTIATWAVEFLCVPHQQLGRRGSVCPYTKPSMDKNGFLLASAGSEHDLRTIEATVDDYRRWFIELLEQRERANRHLLTILVLLPGLDRVDSGPLDALQDRLKDSFVREGLMVGQFHPNCEQSGLWNGDFRPLKAPTPLLAIRQMVASDLPFLVGAALSAYFDRFAPDIPSHIRRLLVLTIMNATDQHPATSRARCDGSAGLDGRHVCRDFATVEAERGGVA